jgi:uncharacterized SAM-binding protein YcdF (DUF218 family)
LEEEALMFFTLSKTAAFLLLPSNFLITLGFIGVVLMATRFKRVGRWLAVASLILLLVAGFSPAGRLLFNALENRFPRWDTSRGPPDGIVVLGGAIVPFPSRISDEPTLTGEAARIIAIGKFARAYPNARIVFTSGDSGVSANGPAEADFLPPLLDSMGVPRARVLLEPRSRNTEENATFTKEMVKPKLGERWLLVTSAWHMPRAVGCFRQIGFPVEAYPVSWRTGKRVGLWPSASFGSGLAATDIAVHEWIGLIAYWLTGRTSELLPGPAPNQ